MKQLLFIISGALLLHCFQAKAQQSDCVLTHHTGKYYYLAGNDTIYIERTKNRQIETFNNGKSQLVLEVKWINDREFLLIFKKFINIPGASCMKKGDAIRVKINQCFTDRYTSSYTTESCGNGFSTFYKLPD